MPAIILPGGPVAVIFLAFCCVPMTSASGVPAAVAISVVAPGIHAPHRRAAIGVSGSSLKLLQSQFGDMWNPCPVYLVLWRSYLRAVCMSRA